MCMFRTNFIYLLFFCQCNSCIFMKCQSQYQIKYFLLRCFFVCLFVLVLVLFIYIYITCWMIQQISLLMSFVIRLNSMGNKTSLLKREYCTKHISITLNFNLLTLINKSCVCLVEIFSSLHHPSQRESILWHGYVITSTTYNYGCNYSDSKVRVANMGPTWGRHDQGVPHVGHMNLAIWVPIHVLMSTVDLYMA